MDKKVTVLPFARMGHIVYNLDQNSIKINDLFT